MLKNVCLGGSRSPTIEQSTLLAGRIGDARSSHYGLQEMENANTVCARMGGGDHAQQLVRDRL